MKKLEQYRFRNGTTPLNEEELNGRFFDIDARIHLLEGVKLNLEETISAIQNLSLDQINENFMPMLLQLKSDTESDLLELRGQINDALAQVNVLLESLEGGTVDVSRIRGGSAAITYTDGMVTRISYTVPTGTFDLFYTYNPDGSVEAVTAKLNDETVWMRTYTYDETGAVSGWTEG